jgi:hypothetical protein
MRFIFLFFLMAWNIAYAATPKIGDVTDSPQKYVLAHAEFPEDGLTQFDCGACSTMKDSLFIAATRECGNAGCSFYIFKKEKGLSYIYLTTIFLSSGGFQFLKTSHHGYPDILTYHHMSAAEGTLSTFEFNGKEYLSKDQGRTIKSSESGSYVKAEPVKQEYFTKDLKKVVQ